MRVFLQEHKLSMSCFYGSVLLTFFGPMFLELKIELPRRSGENVPPFQLFAFFRVLRGVIETVRRFVSSRVLGAYACD